MPNSLYAKGREGFLDGTIDWDTNTIKCVFTDHGADTPNTTTDDNLDDISAGTIATSPAFTSPTCTNGTADAADVTVTSVTGAQFESINIFKDTGVASSSRLIAFIDTATGLPLTPNGGDVTISWDNGSNRIFTL